MRLRKAIVLILSCIMVLASGIQAFAAVNNDETVGPEANNRYYFVTEEG